MYWNEFALVALVHLLAVVSPGPDFAVVIRNSVSAGHRAGLYTAIGFGLTKIPRPGPDRFPDRFLEYLPERRLYLA